MLLEPNLIKKTAEVKETMEKIGEEKVKVSAKEELVSKDEAIAAEKA